MSLAPAVSRGAFTFFGDLMEPVRLAILDLNNNTPNLSIGRLKELVGMFADAYEYQIFDVRGKAEVPDLSFDVYISSGGPGSPHDGDGVWDVLFYDWMEAVWHWNLADEMPKKQVFFICHSFQIACKHFGIGTVSRRRSPSFGIFPVFKTEMGKMETFFSGLPNPFHVADFRDWQVVDPDAKRLDELGAEILALEKVRPHVPLERAIMVVRFSQEIFGTQFHPEADAKGMLHHFEDPVRKAKIITDHSEEKYLEMIEHLNDPDKISLTQRIILPIFLSRALRAVRAARLEQEPVM